MEIILEILAQFFFELLGQILFEALAELGIRSVSNALGIARPRNPILAIIGYILFASIGAGLSLWYHPNHFIKTVEYRTLNLFITPIFVGLIMNYRGKSLLAKEKEIIRLDTFLYGFMFAFTFAAIRLWFGK